MNDYLRITSGEVKINTPSKLIKTEIIEQRPDFLHTKSYYENGIELEFWQSAKEIAITTNGKNMILNPDGTVDIES